MTIKFYKKWIFILKMVAIFSIAIILGSSCSKTGSNTGSLELTDSCERSISLEKPAEKIIALSASDCEVLCAIDAKDTIIGRGTYCDYPQDIKSIKDYGSGELMNIEEIVAAKPDVVLMSKTGFTLDQVNAVEKAGIKTLVNEANSLDDTYTYIDLLGRLTAKEQNANNLISSMKQSILDIENKTKANGGDKTKTVYFEVSPPQYGLWAAGSGTFMDEAANILQLKNIFNDAAAWAQISSEQVISRNPDYIVTVTMYEGAGASPVDEIYSRTGWENVSAVKDKNVMWLDNNSITRPGPRLVDAISSMYEFVYKK